MIVAFALMVGLAAAPATDEWVVRVVAGKGPDAIAGPCGPRRVLAGASTLSTTSMTPPPKTPPPFVTGASSNATWQIPLFWQAGLFGLDGDVLVVAAEIALRAAGLDGAVSLVVRERQALLQITTTAATSATSLSSALTALAPDGRQFTSVLQAATARRAWRHSRAGVTALEEIDGVLCFPAAVISTTTTTLTSAGIRAALAGPVLSASL